MIKYISIQWKFSGQLCFFQGIRKLLKNPEWWKIRIQYSEKFLGNSAFQDKRKLLKFWIWKVYSIQWIFRVTLFFRASASCSKILNDKKYFNTVKNSRATLFFKASASCLKSWIIKNIFSTVKSGHPLFFRANASCSKLLNLKSIFNTV